MQWEAKDYEMDIEKGNAALYLPHLFQILLQNNELLANVVRYTAFLEAIMHLKVLKAILHSRVQCWQ